MRYRIILHFLCTWHISRVCPGSSLVASSSSACFAKVRYSNPSPLRDRPWSSNFRLSGITLEATVLLSPRSSCSSSELLDPSQSSKVGSAATKDTIAVRTTASSSASSATFTTAAAPLLPPPRTFLGLLWPSSPSTSSSPTSSAAVCDSDEASPVPVGAPVAGEGGSAAPLFRFFFRLPGAPSEGTEEEATLTTLSGEVTVGVEEAGAAVSGSCATLSPQGTGVTVDSAGSKRLRLRTLFFGCFTSCTTASAGGGHRGCSPSSSSSSSSKLMERETKVAIRAARQQEEPLAPKQSGPTNTVPPSQTHW
eukprot:RCo049237